MANGAESHPFVEVRVRYYIAHVAGGCVQPADPVNGLVNAPDVVLPGSSAYFACDSGFSLAGFHHLPYHHLPPGGPRPSPTYFLFKL